MNFSKDMGYVKHFQVISSRQIIAFIYPLCVTQITYLNANSHRRRSGSCVVFRNIKRGLILPAQYIYAFL